MTEKKWCRRCKVEAYPFCEYCTDTIKRAAAFAKVSFKEYADLRYPEEHRPPVIKGTVLLDGKPLPTFPT